MTMPQQLSNSLTKMFFYCCDRGGIHSLAPFWEGLSDVFNKIVLKLPYMNPPQLGTLFWVPS